MLSSDFIFNPSVGFIPIILQTIQETSFFFSRVQELDWKVPWQSAIEGILGLNCKKGIIY